MRPAGRSPQSPAANAGRREDELDRCEVAIVGSGFAGSLLARILRRLGYDVVLIERTRHPRFALGESSTPLANLCLERLSQRYGLSDLWELAAHGRWVSTFPDLRRGLKRGFTFYRHRAGARFANDEANFTRLLVAASPSDRVADTHWLRADVDDHFVRLAVAAGVDYRDETELSGLRVAGNGVRLSGEQKSRALDLHARFVVDASGAGGFLSRHLPIASALSRTKTRSSLVFGHFSGARLFADVAREEGAAMPDGPYPDDRAAVHHVFRDGWMYVLRFDDGTVSAGFLSSPNPRNEVASSPDRVWQRRLARYPSVAAQFADAQPVRPIGCLPRIQHRRERAVGDRWALLPHTYAFVDPLYSTGIAWSLLAVERLALAFERRRLPAPATLEQYGSLLSREADQIDALVSGAYLAMRDFELFTSHAMLYFAAVSFAEIRQRLKPTDSAAWDGFLGVEDPVIAPLFRRSAARLRRAPERFRRWVSESIAPRNVAGLADPARRNLYPVDLDGLVERASLLGLTAREVRDALPRLRGM